MAELTEKAIQSIAQLVRSTGAPQFPSEKGVPYVLVPDGNHLEGLDKFIFNDHVDHPERVRASVSVLDTESFVHYYTLFSDENSRVFAYEPEIKVVAVLDYHGALAGGPRWCQHKVTLTLRKSEEWARWTGANNRQMSQTDFAEFLEQNSIDITKPSPAHMMEVARDLQATTEVEFGSGTRMQDGQVRFKYTESTKATVGAGQLQVPERFTITLPVFVGGQRIDMDALLRFRVKEGKLVIWYTLVRPEEVIRQAFISARARIANELKITILNGQP